MIRIRPAAWATAGLWLVSCATPSAPAKQPAPSTQAAAAPATPPAPPAPPAPKPTYGTFGFDSSGMDPSVSPGDDFYRYANGKWEDHAEIPADRSSTGMFAILDQQAQQRSRELLEGAASGSDADTRKLSDFYRSFMDESAIEAKGLSPIQPELSRISKIANRKQLATELGDTLRADVDVLITDKIATDRLFGLWVTVDLNDPSHYAPYLLQGGLGLPDRDYYLVANPRFAEIRTKYQEHIAAMFKLAGISDGEARAKRIVALENQIAQAHWPLVETHDIHKANNPWTRKDFAKKAPGLDWDAFFKASGLSGEPTITVWQPSAITGIAKLVGSVPLATWKDYLTFHAIERGAPFLTKALVDESFAFNGKTLSGAKEIRPRWKRAVAVTDAAMGDALGKLYVAKYFPPEAKERADTMVKNIVAALGRHIDSLAWMSAPTKARAKEKLATLYVGIGQPEKWRDYAALEVVAGDAFGNHERAERFELQRQLQRIHQPVDRTEWFMVPQEVNAVNAPQQNSIVFPAAILQPPFFDPNADPAVNYGGIGSVIGHEITHSFDNTGAAFDAHGKLENWWTPEDLKNFTAASTALAKQFDTYHPLPDARVNGELTLGEDIADLGGVSISLDAYRASLNGQPAPVIAGFTGEQRFFLGFAQVWRSKFREAALRRQMLTNEHAPGPVRAQTVRNLDPWYAAFAVKPEQKLFLGSDQRVRMW